MHTNVIVQSIAYWLVAVFGLCFYDQPIAEDNFTEQTKTVDFGPDNQAAINFSQQPNQFTLVSLPTHGIAYSLFHSANPKKKTHNPLLIGSDPSFTLSSRLLITGNECLDCTIFIKRPELTPAAPAVTVNITTYHRHHHTRRYDAEILYRQLFTGGTFDDTHINADRIIQQFQSLNTPEDDVRACEIALFRTTESKLREVQEVTDCIQLLKKQNKPYLANLFLVEKARHLWSLDQTDNALDTLALVLAQSSSDQEKQTENQFIQASANLILGMIYNKKGNFDKTDHHFNSAITLFNTLGEKTLLADTLIEQGLSYRFRNQFTRAANTLEQAHRATLSTQRRYPYQAALIKYNMAIVSALSGRYYHAYRLIDSLTDYADNRATPIWRAHILAARARIVMELGRLNEAESIYQEVWQLYEQQQARSHLATVSNNLANLHIKKGNFESARHYLEQAARFQGTQWGKDQNLRIRQAKVNYYQSNGDLEAALSELDAMTPEVTAGEESYRLGRFLIQKANILILSGRFDAALTTLEKALPLNEAASDNLSVTRAYYLNAAALYHSQAQHNQGQYNQAAHLQVIRRLNQAKALIESTRAEMTDDRVRQEYFALQKEIYALAIRAHQTLNQKDSALMGLYNAESFRARTLYETLSQSKTTVNATDTSDAEFLQSSFSLFESTPDASSLPKLSLDELNQFKSTMNDDDAILYFFAGETESHLWFVSKQTLKLVPLPSNAELSLQIEPLIEQMLQDPNSNPVPSLWHRLVALNRQVSDLILAPIRQELSTVSNLTIIPDGVLHRLSFAFLLDPNNASPAPLIANINIRYASSIATQFWLDQYQPTTNKRNGILLVANPSLQAESMAVASLRSGEILGNLPEAEVEAYALMAMWKNRGDNRLLVREQSTKTNFAQSHPENYQVIHFAGHATIDWDNPALTAIKLAPENSHRDDDLNIDLTLGDIANMKLDAEMVVLSACETAAGRLTTGEGPIGLSRAFIEAGSARVLASLWPVNDKATSILLQHFYDSLLNQPVSPAEALRMAQKKMMQNNDYFHPFYWAGFIFIGKDQPWLPQTPAFQPF